MKALKSEDGLCLSNPRVILRMRSKEEKEEREREKKNMTDIKVSMETRLQVNFTEFPHPVGLTMIPSTVVWCVTCFVRECTSIYLVTFSTLR